MRYLKLYEAFSSNTLSKLYNHLKKKNTSRKSLIHFKADFDVITKSLDIPMDKISDEDISYLSRKKALPLREEAKNDSGIWVIKFWFDKDGEYIGTSGTGNSTFESLSRLNTTRQCRPYSKEQWGKIRKSMTFGFPKTGYLTPVLKNEYGKLKSGDEVIGCFSNSDDYEEYVDTKVDSLTYARIFVDSKGIIYAMSENENADGESPDDNPEVEYPDIEWGGYAWQLTEGNNIPATDHFNLYKITKSDTPLGYYQVKNDKEDILDPFDFNVTLEEIEDGKLALSSWEGNYDERNKIDKEADFSIILFVDGVLSRGLKSKAVTSGERKEARKGAVALISDEDYKKANIDKYLNLAVEKLGVTPESVELKNLEKVVASIVSSGIGESYSFFSIWNREYKKLDNFSYQIKRLVSCISTGKEEVLKFVYKDFLSDYKILKKQNATAYTGKKVTLDIFKENEVLKPLYDIMMRISSKVSKGVLSKEIVRGEDLKKMYFRLDSIEEMMKDSDFEVSHDLKDFIENVRLGVSDPDLIRRKISRMIEGDYLTYKYDNNMTMLEIDLKNLEEIESYVEDIFGK